MTVRPAALATATALALLVAGCGVPTHTEVRVEGPPPEAGAPDFARPDPPPGPDDATSESQLVDFFLQAAARDPENAVEELRAFIHSDEREGWQPDSQLYVVRASQEEDRVDTPGDPFRVNLTVRRVGQLTDDGLIEPRVQDEQDIELLVTTERATPAEGQDDAAAGSQERFRIRNPPPFVLLDDVALRDFFEQRPLYFWDSDSRKLVPDLRWLPTAMPDLQRPQAVVEWLLAGPAPWLSGAAAAVPDGIELDGNVIWDDDNRKLKIPLTAPHDTDVDLRQLDAQLWWTLRPEIADAQVEVVLVVDGGERRLGSGYRSSNPVPADPPASFAVLAGEVRQYLPDEPVALPLDDETDQEVARAAATRDGELIALVWQDSADQQRLAVAGPAGLTETDLVATAMGRPVWLDNPSGTGLVPADGALHQFRVHEDGEVEVAPVELADLPTPVTAVAAAPDGRRLALVASGRVFVVSVTRAGGGVSVSRHQQLPTTATSLDGVAFLRENWLAVVGTARGRSRLYELTVDGAQEAELPGSDQVGAPASITSFVAFPADPAEPAARGTIMFEADGRTYRYVHPSQPSRIEAADLHDYEPAPDGDDPDPQAPFFLD